MAAAAGSFFSRTFPDFWAQTRGRPYAIFDTFRLSSQEVSRLRTSAAEAWNVYRRIDPLLRALPDETLHEMGVPAEAVDICRRGAALPSVVARFDFAYCNDGFKVLELNAETPFFTWESFEISGAVARVLGGRDPNQGCEAQLGAALAQAVAGCAHVAVAGYNSYREDYFTAQYLARVTSAALGRPVRFAPLHELRVAAGEGLFDERGRIDALIRTYPLEWLARDPGGAALFDLIAHERVRVVNPPAALLLQNKLTQVLIWGLAERGEFFSPEERESIRRTFLPTYADLPKEGTFVCKPAYGREGDSVRIVRDGETLARSMHEHYGDQPVVYQEFRELSTVEFEHPGGQRGEGAAVFTCFMCGGEASAIGVRVGGAITDVDAMFLPVCG